MPWGSESNGSVGAERLSHSLPGSPSDKKPNFEVIGSAENLVGRVMTKIILNQCKKITYSKRLANFNILRIISKVASIKKLVKTSTFQRKLILEFIYKHGKKTLFIILFFSDI